MGMRPRRRCLYILAVVAFLSTESCQFTANLDGGPYWPCPEDGECPAGCSCLDGQVCVPDGPDDSASVCAWCEPGKRDCDGQPGNGCEVDPLRDSEHCGGCDISCGQNSVCDNGACGCLVDWADCFGGLEDGCETYLVDNDQHCGGCNVTCDRPPQPFCENSEILIEFTGPGECAGVTCSYAKSSRVCPNGCENGQCKPDACGGVTCRDEETCVDGRCVCVADNGEELTCDDGQRCCGGICIPRYDNDANCGACNNQCPEHTHCEEESCVCDAYWGNCDTSNPDCETFVKTSDTHCGMCNNPCGPNQHCAEMDCSCDPGWDDCDTSVDNGCETNITSNHDHCGGCNLPCPGEHVCCDGDCADTSSNLSHCGGCGIECSADEDECCDGSCVDSMSSLDHCGACNTPCPDGEDLCCGGSCADSTSSSDHCGTCFHACVPGKPCQDGHCGVAGEVDCGGNLCNAADDMQCCWDGNTLGCHPVTDCFDQVLYCDGPEDCEPGEVCCRPPVAGALSKCHLPDDCSPLVLCSSDQDCAEAVAGPHCCPADLEGVVIYACTTDDC